MAVNIRHSILAVVLIGATSGCPDDPPPGTDATGPADSSATQGASTEASATSTSGGSMGLDTGSASSSGLPTASASGPLDDTGESGGPEHCGDPQAEFSIGPCDQTGWVYHDHADEPGECLFQYTCQCRGPECDVAVFADQAACEAHYQNLGCSLGHHRYCEECTEQEVCRQFFDGTCGGSIPQCLPLPPECEPDPQCVFGDPCDQALCMEIATCSTAGCDGQVTFWPIYPGAFQCFGK